MANTISVKDGLGATQVVATNDAVKASVDLVKTAADGTTTAVGIVDSSVNDVKASVDAGNVLLGTLDGSVDAVKASVDAVAALISTLDGSVDATTAAITALQAVVAAGSAASLGAETVANSPAVNIASDQPPLSVNPLSTAADVKQSFTRQNNVTPYTAGQIVGALAATMTFPNLGKAGGASIMLTSAELEIDIATAPATAFRLHLYSSAPASAPADATNFDGAADVATWLGWIDFPAPTDVGGVVMSQANNIGKQLRATGADVYGVLQALTGYTPVALAVYKVSLHRVEV